VLGSQKIAALVGTTDAGRAKAFYSKALGLRLVSEEPIALVFDANGTMLRVHMVAKVAEAKYTVLGWNVRTSLRPRRIWGRPASKWSTSKASAWMKLGIWTAKNGTKVG
jgi:hypothetical protein